MPFRSKSQERWMFANKPEMAREWAAATPKGANLPERVQKSAAKPRGRKKGLGKLLKLMAIGLLAGCGKPAISPEMESAYYAELLAAEESGKTCQEAVQNIAAVERRWAQAWAEMQRPPRRAPILVCERAK